MEARCTATAYGCTIKKIFDEDDAMAAQSTTNVATDEARLLLLLGTSTPLSRRLRTSFSECAWRFSET